MADRAAVRNAADPGQVGQAARTDRRREAQLAAYVQSVLSTYEGRAVLWGIVQAAGVQAGIFDHSGSVTYFKAGRQDFGFELFRLFEDADEDAWAQARAEARARARFDDKGAEAARTPSAQEKKT